MFFHRWNMNESIENVFPLLLCDGHMYTADHTCSNKLFKWTLMLCPKTSRWTIWHTVEWADHTVHPQETGRAFCQLVVVYTVSISDFFSTLSPIHLSLSLFLAAFLSNSCQYISLDQSSLVPFCQCHWWWSGIPQGCNIQHWTGYWPRPFDSWQTSWMGNEKNPDKHS